MRLREKLTVEEKVAIALELIKRERALDEICDHYRVSHTTAYKLRNQFLEGGRRALCRDERHSPYDLEARVRALEEHVAADGRVSRTARVRSGPRARATVGSEM
jgi:transposase-like protein